MTLRIGVTWNADDPTAWHVECVDRLLAVTGVQLALLIEAFRDGAGGTRPRPPGRRAPAFLQHHSARGMQTLSGVPRIAGRIEGADVGRLVLTGDQVDRVRQADLDFIVHLASADPAAEIFAATRFGVWSFHHGDGTRYSMGPVTEWEPYCREPALHIALVATLGEGSPLLAVQTGCLRVGPKPWPEALEPILRSVAQWPAKIGREALSFGESPLARARPVQWFPVKPHSPTLALRRSLSRFGARWRHYLHGRLGRWREDQWAIGIVHAPIHTSLDGMTMRSVVWVPEYARHEYLADPFARRSAEGAVILCERFDHRTLRGEICAVDSPDGSRFGRPRTVLALPAHLSYPFLFEHEGTLYCIPEIGQSRGVQLFEFNASAATWRFVMTLIDDFAGLDPTIVWRGDRLWLFCTERDNPQAALHIWWAHALTGPWFPHCRNPVKFDVRSTRPAGTPFEHGGQLYRPSQDCFESYGSAIRINRIVRLTADDFEEDTVAVLRPDAKGPYPAGLHTLSALGEWTLIDGKRRRWRFPWRPRGFAAPDMEAFRQALDRLSAAASCHAGGTHPHIPTKPAGTMP
jgi:hypothetical protein